MNCKTFKMLTEGVQLAVFLCVIGTYALDLLGPRDGETGRFLYTKSSDREQHYCRICPLKALQDSTYAFMQIRGCLRYYNDPDYYNKTLTDYERENLKFAFCEVGDKPVCPQNLPTLPNKHWHWVCSNGIQPDSVGVYQACYMTSNEGNHSFEFYCSEKLEFKSNFTTSLLPTCEAIPGHPEYNIKCSNGYNHSLPVPINESCNATSRDGNHFYKFMCMNNQTWSPDPVLLFEPEEGVISLPIWVIPLSCVLGVAVVVTSIVLIVVCFVMPKWRSSSREGSISGTSSSVSSDGKEIELQVIVDSPPQPTNDCMNNNKMPKQGTVDVEETSLSSNSPTSVSTGTQVSGGNSPSSSRVAPAASSQPSSLASSNREPVEHIDEYDEPCESDALLGNTDESRDKCKDERYQKPGPNQEEDKMRVSVRVFHEHMRQSQELQENCYSVPKGFDFYVAAKCPKNKCCTEFRVEWKDGHQCRGVPLQGFTLLGLYVFRSADMCDAGVYLWTLTVDSETFQGFINIFVHDVPRPDPQGQEESTDTGACPIPQLPILAPAAPEIHSGDLEEHRIQGSVPSANLQSLGSNLTLGSLRESRIQSPNNSASLRMPSGPSLDISSMQSTEQDIINRLGPQGTSGIPNSNHANPQVEGYARGESDKDLVMEPRYQTLHVSSFDRDQTMVKATYESTSEDRPSVAGQNSGEGHRRGQGQGQSQDTQEGPIAGSPCECTQKIVDISFDKKETLSHYGDPTNIPGGLKACFYGLGRAHGMSKPQLDAIAWHRRGFVGRGPMLYVLEFLGVNKGFYVCHLLNYFTQQDSRREDIVRFIRKFHHDCAYCRRKYYNS